MGNVCECLFPREEPQANHNSHAAPTKTTESVPVQSSVENDAAVVSQPVDGKGVDVNDGPISWSSPVFSYWGPTEQEKGNAVVSNRSNYTPPIPPPPPPPPKEVDDPYSGKQNAKPQKRIPVLVIIEPHVRNDEENRAEKESSGGRSVSGQTSHSEVGTGTNVFVPKVSKPVAPMADVPKLPQSEEQDVRKDSIPGSNPFSAQGRGLAAPFPQSSHSSKSLKGDGLGISAGSNGNNPFGAKASGLAAPFPQSPSSKLLKEYGLGVDVGSNPFALNGSGLAAPFPQSPSSKLLKEYGLGVDVGSNPFSLNGSGLAAPFPQSSHSSKSLKGDGLGISAGSNGNNPFGAKASGLAAPFPQSPSSKLLKEYGLGVDADSSDNNPFGAKVSGLVAPFPRSPSSSKSQTGGGYGVDADSSDSNPFGAKVSGLAAPFPRSPSSKLLKGNGYGVEAGSNPFKLPQNKHAAPFPDSPHSSKSQKGNGHGVDAGSNPFKLPQNKHAALFPDSPRSSRSSKHRTSSRLRNPLVFKRDSKLSSLAV